VAVAVDPPLERMLARLARELPADGWRPDRDPGSCLLEQLEPPEAEPYGLLS
jgi:hypothetical protein